MSKPYDYGFCHTNNGSTGAMICEICKQKIINSKYMFYKKDFNGDWGYKTYHLSCALLNKGFSSKYDQHVKAEEDANLQTKKEIEKEKKRAIELINSATNIYVEDDYGQGEIIISLRKN